jgi:phenylpyruvate tautomerase PptA (4-oxalocrotonate tautomerase family)
LPESVVWAATELELLDHNNTLSRSHMRTLGEFLLRFGGANSPTAQTKTTRTRTKQTKAEVRSELTERISEFLNSHPGATLTEVSDALGAPLPAITTAARPVEWLILGEDELTEPTERVESQTISVTRERARGALQAANLMASPLTHNAYTALLRSGRIQGPSVARIVQLFGSWTAACTSVGVASGEALRRNYERTWTAEDLLAFVERYLRDPMYRGASHQFDVWRATVNGAEKVPSLGTVRNIVGGTWNDIRTTTLRKMRATWQ